MARRDPYRCGFTLDIPPALILTIAVSAVVASAFSLVGAHRVLLHRVVLHRVVLVVGGAAELVTLLGMIAIGVLAVRGRSRIGRHAAALRAAVAGRDVREVLAAEVDGGPVSDVVFGTDAQRFPRPARAPRGPAGTGPL